MHSIHLTKKGNPGLKTCDGYQELLKFSRSDIIEVASRLQKGGLGYMEDTSEFEERVRDIKTTWSGHYNQYLFSQYGNGTRYSAASYMDISFKPDLSLVLSGA